MRPRFFERDFSAEKAAFPGLRFEVERLEREANGGPKRAVVKVYGPEGKDRALIEARREAALVLDVWEAIDLLRCPVELEDEDGEAAWWGWVEAAAVQIGALQLTISVERMGNKVQVVYSQVNSAGTVGQRAETAWISDAESITEYGLKERRFTLAEGTDDQAAAAAATWLERYKWPTAQRSFLAGSARAATLYLRGWWDTLGWVYYTNSQGKESYESIGNGLQAFGNAAESQKVAQSLQLAGTVAWSASSIQVRMRKEKVPGDTITAKLCANGAGGPGTVLASGSLTAAEISENLNWHTFALNTRVSLSAGTTYWITVERSGGLDAENYYKIDANEELGYSRGVFRIWNGAAWAARSPEADMLFIVGGVQETTQQLKAMLTTAGQFFTGVDIETASGVWSNPFRDGDRSALACVVELLESGTANGRRLLATVTRGRRVRVYEEPAPSSEDYLVDASGQLYRPPEDPVKPWLYPAGTWVRIKDAPFGNKTRMADLTRFFAERAYFDGRTGYLEERQ